MSKISLQPNASGNGTFSIVAPDSNTNRTLTLPDESGAVLSDVSDIAADKLTGDIAADRMKDGFNASGSAPVFACRAWVNFDGTGTVAIRDSGNVSSITDTNTGAYQINLTNAMPDANYGISGLTSFFHYITSATDVTTTKFNVNTVNTSGTRVDVNFVSYSVFR